MYTKSTIRIVFACVVILALLLLSCSAPATETEQGTTVTGETTTPTTPTTPTAPTTPTTPTTPEAGTEGPEYGGTINLVAIEDPRTTDPYYSSGTPDIFISFWTDQLGVGKWEADREGCSFIGFSVPLEYMRGLLAESWDVPDLKTYVFHIRQGVHFHNKPPANGRELTAYDVAYAYQRLFGLGDAPGITERSVIATGQADWQALESVEAIDKWTVVFKLNSEQPRFLEFVVGSAINDYVYPPEVVEQYGDLTDWRNACGSGPFMVVDFVPASSITFEKNPNYWGHDERNPSNRLPYADTVKILIMPDLSTRLAAVRAGKIDTIAGLTPEQTQQLNQSNPNLQWLDVYSSGYQLTLRNDIEPFSDIRVRKAMQMAMDNQTLTDTYYSGYADPFPSFLNRLQGDVYAPLEEYPPDVQEGFTYNPEKAKELLAEAGYPNGFKTLMVMSSAGPTDLAEVVKTYLEAINVDVEIKVYEPASLTAVIYAEPRGYDILFQGSRGVNVGFIDMISWHMQPASWNFAEVDDPELVRRVEEIKSTADAAKRTQLTREAHMYDNSQFYTAGLPIRKLFTCWQPWLKGYSGEQHLGSQNPGSLWARCWVNQDLKYEETGVRD